MVKNSDISTLSRAIFSELIIYNTRQGDFLYAYSGKKKVTMVVMT